ncbi:uncharacterized protein [Littorina saxatilis]|uniref:uncharacterized protein n=1 Tax=Littorina saxatilis TaxID=31220 RepID=UPI0038B4CBDF
MLLFGPYTSSLFLLCVFTLGQNVLSQTGSNCTAGYRCEEQCYSDDCKLKNVALCKSVDSSSLKPFHQLECAAVDGITGTDYGCVETLDSDNNTYWRVDLGQTFTIPNITLYGRSFYFLRMLGIRIYVDDQLCHTIGVESSYPQHNGNPVPIHVQCNPPLTGSVVKLVKNCTSRTGSCQQHTFSLCEVQVWEEDTAASEAKCFSVTVVAVTITVAVAVAFVAVGIVVCVCMRNGRGNPPGSEKQ